MLLLFCCCCCFCFYWIFISGTSYVHPQHLPPPHARHHTQKAERSLNSRPHQYWLVWLKKMSGDMSSSETQNVRCQGRANYSTLNLVVRCQSKRVSRQSCCLSKVLSPNISGVTGTDVMDAYLTGGVDRPTASGTTRYNIITPPPPPPPPRPPPPTSTYATTNNIARAQPSEQPPWAGTTTTVTPVIIPFYTLRLTTWYVVYIYIYIYIYISYFS